MNYTLSGSLAKDRRIDAFKGTWYDAQLPDNIKSNLMSTFVRQDGTLDGSKVLQEQGSDVLHEMTTKHIKLNEADDKCV